ncbi:MAG TPA: tetratricopeptide repeat protein, partial [Planctomycetes bacterium]|nr:tetratricopeptide repeat protein [Planctomycetota bacterium]
PRGRPAPRPLGELLIRTNGKADLEPEDVVAEAGRVVEHLLECFPRNVDAWEVKARFHDWLGQSDKAVATWQECLDRDRYYAYAWVGLASTALRKGEFARAEEFARQAVDCDASNFQARAILAQALLHQGRPQEASDVLDAFVQVDPRSQGHYLLGEAYYQLGQYEKARAHYRAATELYGDYAEAYHGLAEACRRLGREEEASRAMERFRSFTRPERFARRVRGMARSDLEALSAGAAVLYSDAGRLYLLGGRARDAEALWRRAAELDPKHVGCRQSLAFVCRREGRLREAIGWLEQLAALEPANPSYPLEIGGLWEQLFEYEAAERAFRRALRIDPEGAPAYAALAALLLKRKDDTEEAIQLAKAAVQHAPTAAHYALLASACQAGGQTEPAREAIQRAMKLDPANQRYRDQYDQLLAQPSGETIQRAEQPARSAE